MKIHWLVATLLLCAALGGCFGGGGGAKSTDTPTTTPTETGRPQNQSHLVTVRILNASAEAPAGGPINVTWEVSVNASALNQSFIVDHTDVHYGDESIDEPRNESAYGNMTASQFGMPGVYNATFTVEEPGRIYLRAHAVLNASSYWSEEAVVEVTAQAKTWTVQIGSRSPGPMSNYEPSPLTVKLGDGVQWHNVDPLMLSHTATNDAGAPSRFDTDTIQPGQESGVVIFQVAGTYAYHCSLHPDTMRGSIVVTPA